ncbi:hypothetical protein FBBNIHIM_02415 [Pseudocitrobacter vendiensis]|uniref:Uncharacterized protein n=1 Tax=Pseudocitrobacter vendiensis TaxID=2488306 RepID=A0ABN8T666_9ENTR|nr:hypothetical protein FBBNIHIM_02415 [Pseudocitrobacter vendiensis]
MDENHINPLVLFLLLMNVSQQGVMGGLFYRKCFFSTILI